MQAKGAYFQGGCLFSEVYGNLCFTFFRNMLKLLKFHPEVILKTLTLIFLNQNYHSKKNLKVKMKKNLLNYQMLKPYVYYMIYNANSFESFSSFDF
jgi:hypothetical protein